MVLHSQVHPLVATFQKWNLQTKKPHGGKQLKQECFSHLRLRLQNILEGTINSASPARRRRHTTQQTQKRRDFGNFGRGNTLDKARWMHKVMAILKFLSFCHFLASLKKTMCSIFIWHVLRFSSSKYFKDPIDFELFFLNRGFSVRSFAPPLNQPLAPSRPATGCTTFVAPVHDGGMLANKPWPYSVWCIKYIYVTMSWLSFNFSLNNLLGQIWSQCGSDCGS